MADEGEKAALTIHIFRIVYSTAIHSMGLSDSLEKPFDWRRRPICLIRDLSLGACQPNCLRHSIGIIKSRRLSLHFIHWASSHTR